MKTFLFSITFIVASLLVIGIYQDWQNQPAYAGCKEVSTGTMYQEFVCPDGTEYFTQGATR